MKNKKYIIIGIIIFLFLMIVIEIRITKYETILQNINIPNGETLPEYSNLQKVYMSLHLHDYKMKRYSATCTKEEYIKYMCKCGAIKFEITNPPLDHSFVVKEIIEFATPFNPGKQISECTICGSKQENSYNMTMEGPNSLYIPGVVNAKFVKTSWEQSFADDNDIIYASYRGRPVILGHNTGSIGPLYNTRIGQKIYVSLDGVVKTYQVVVSEQGFDRATDIIGVNGNRLMQNGNYLRIYTCYNTRYDGDNSRWFVLAVETENS